MNIRDTHIFQPTGSSATIVSGTGQIDVEEGDLLVAVISAGAGIGINPVTSSGWTELHATYVSTPSTSESFSVLMKIAEAGDTGPANTWTFAYGFTQAGRIGIITSWADPDLADFNDYTVSEYQGVPDEATNFIGGVPFDVDVDVDTNTYGSGGHTVLYVAASVLVNGTGNSLVYDGSVTPGPEVEQVDGASNPGRIYTYSEAWSSADDYEAKLFTGGIRAGGAHVLRIFPAIPGPAPATPSSDWTPPKRRRRVSPQAMPHKLTSMWLRSAGGSHRG